MSNYLNKKFLLDFRAATRVYQFLFGFTVLLLSLTFEKALIQTLVQNRFSSVAEAANSSRNFEGLNLDSPGTAALLLNVVEKSGYFFVYHLRVSPSARLTQEFSADFAPGKNFRLYRIPIMSFPLRYQGSDYRISAEALLSLPATFAVIMLALCLALLSNFLFASFQKWKEREAQSIAAVKLERLAMQVAHDIRSPLAALGVIENDLNDLPEDSRLIIRDAINRIRDIAADLLAKNHSPMAFERRSSRAVTKTRSQHLASLISEIVTEKRMQYRNSKNKIELKSDITDNNLFSVVNGLELKRALSNLIDNSFDAVAELDHGLVEVALKAGSFKALIHIRDNGRGIAAEILPILGNQGVTHGKIDGIGLGLFHAKTTCEDYGGTLKIDSKLYFGTCVTLTLPLSPTPEKSFENVQPVMCQLAAPDKIR